MPYWLKAILICFLSGIVGVVIILLGFGLEEGVGLHVLFKVRGPRPAPAEVLVVTTDRDSGQALLLSEKVDEWPRAVHARLTEALAQGGATAIAYDIIFEKARQEADDRRFAEAISAAGNVVLCEHLEKESRPLASNAARDNTTIHVERLVSPLTLLANSAAALAPFPLPKKPGVVSSYWTIKTIGTDTPTFPVVAFQVHALAVYDTFYALLQQVAPSLTAKLPPNKHSVLVSKGAADLVLTARDLFHRNPHLAGALLEAIEKTEASEQEKRTLRSLVSLYSSEPRQRLNFYGPPGTLPTIPYHEALRSLERPAGDTGLDVAGKAVFVGLSELFRADQEDDFYTVFARKTGVYHSGVEIAATAFSNLLEDAHIKPLSRKTMITLVFFWGALLGAVCWYCSWAIAGGVVLALGALYFFGAQHQFNTANIWYPLIAPLGLQAPLSFFGVHLFKYIGTNRERQAIKEAFGYYLPADVVNQVARRVVNVKTAGQTVYGACLSTDAGGYTAVSEAMEPAELRGFMNNYYEAVFQPVKRHRGIVSDVIGDSMLALWTTVRPASDIRRNACIAALEIDEAVADFNGSARDGVKLETRIGVHFGEMLVGSIGAVDHYEYRAVGDCISTVSRIEGLNKSLGTRLLVSEMVLDGVNDLVVRKLGSFLLRGKSKPQVIYELIGKADQATPDQQELCAVFSRGLQAFEQQAWNDAVAFFEASSRIVHNDGPSQFYLNLCKRYAQNPPREGWSGEVRVEEK